MIRHFFPAPAHGAPESRVMMMLTNGSRPRFSSGAGFSAATSAAAGAGIFFASLTFAAGFGSCFTGAAAFLGALATGVAAFLGALATGLVAGNVGLATG